MGELRNLGMMYHIVGLCPRTDIAMSRCNFGIALYPAWRDAVKASGITQENIQAAIKNYHRVWLDGCGFSEMFDPDRAPMAFLREERKAKLGPSARPLYDIHSIRIAWGEWGPEHITVPGNACGLDIERRSYRGGAMLQPHNIDGIDQAMLLLTVFTTLADHVILDLEVKGLP